jgi:hypothetical protein
MIIRILFSLILLVVITPASLGQKKVNFIIQINERLAIDGLSGINFSFDSVDSKEKYNVEYVPGELTISDDLWTRISSDTSKRIFLKFDYNTFTGDRHDIAIFFVEMKKYHLEQQYMILNIYDFRNRKYKHWYQWHTDKHFLAELNFPNSGVYIRKS